MDEPITVRRLVGGGHTGRLALTLFAGIAFALGAAAHVATSGAPFAGLEGILTFGLGAGAIVCLAAGVRSTFALAGPRLEMLLSPARIVAGEPFLLEWSFEGAPTTVRDRVKSLEMTLASKRVVHRSGGRDHDHETPLARRRVHFARGDEVPSGAVEFALPASSPPSGPSRGGDVVWELEARIRSIRGGSSVDRYRVTVLAPE